MTNKTTDNSSLFRLPKFEEINFEDYTIGKKEQNKIILTVDTPSQLHKVVEGLIQNYNIAIRQVEEKTKKFDFEVERYEIEISEKE